MTVNGKVYSRDILRKNIAKKKRRRNCILVLFILCILIALILKVPYLNISSIEIYNNEKVNYDDIYKNAEYVIGQNIIRFNKGELAEKIKGNPYIKDAYISRKFPNSIKIEVKEAEERFFVKNADNYYILDKDLVLLQQRKDLEKENLIELKGEEWHDVLEGEKSKSYMDVREFIETISDLIDKNVSGIALNSILVKSKDNISVYSNNLEIKLGNDSELRDKLNKAFNIILNDTTLMDSSGYIDVSFDGNPVVYRQ